MRRTAREAGGPPGEGSAGAKATERRAENQLVYLATRVTGDLDQSSSGRRLEKNLTETSFKEKNQI